MTFLNFDQTTGVLETPEGYGEFVAFDGATGTVTVAVKNGCFAIYRAEDCYIV